MSIGTLNTRTGAELGTQAHMSHAEGGEALCEAKFKTMYESWGNKPGGCLWTAQWDEQYGGGWVQWCIAEDYYYGDRFGSPWNVYLLEPHDDARILVVNTLDDLIAVHETFQVQDNSLNILIRKLDWPRIAEQFDAVHLTDAGQRATRHSHPVDLYGWDCESTVWLRWAFASTTHLGQRTFKERR